MVQGWGRFRLQKVLLETRWCNRDVYVLKKTWSSILTYKCPSLGAPCSSSCSAWENAAIVATCTRLWRQMSIFSAFLTLFCYKETTVEPRYPELSRDTTNSGSLRKPIVKGYIQGRMIWVRESGKFEITEFETARLNNCTRGCWPGVGHRKNKEWRRGVWRQWGVTTGWRLSLPQLTGWLGDHSLKKRGHELKKTMLLTIRTERNNLFTNNVHACDLASCQLAVYWSVSLVYGNPKAQQWPE